MKYKNKAHQAAYEKGRKAAMEGRVRAAPYGCGSNSERYFRRAWLDGYDRGALELMESVMRRSDADAVASVKELTTDVEWDRALDVARQSISSAA